MPNFNPFDMDMDGDVDGIDFLGFHYFMRHGPGRAAGSAQGRGHTSTNMLASLIGGAVLLVTIVFACLACILTVCSASWPFGLPVAVMTELGRAFVVVRPQRAVPL